MILVVSDTSPIRALDYLGLLPLLGQLYGRVVVPRAVKFELATPPHRMKPVDVSAYDFIEILTPRDAAQVSRFRRTMDIGEAEALALAIEIRAQAVLVDDRAGRKAALASGLHIVGTLGILVDAKAEGHISQIRPLVDKLIDELDFFVSEKLKQEV